MRRDDEDALTREGELGYQNRRIGGESRAL
jgi:hypothetical protein